MKLQTLLVVAVLTFAVVPWTAPSAAAPNGAPARRHQEPAARQPAASPVATEAENLFWQSIMNSTNPAEFEAYLRRFPNGMFSELAQIRLETLSTTATPNAVAGTGSATRFSIEFGDDTGDWPRDGECDDIRFEGDGVASLMIFQDRGRDAADCRQQYDEGRARLFGVDLRSGAIAFGDDSSTMAQNGDCDDPRFEGEGMNPITLHADRGHDAADCRRLYDEGRIRLFGVNPIAAR